MDVEESGGGDCDAAFSITTQEFVAGGWQVQFSNESEGIIETITWTFGDGLISDEDEPAHIYATGGDFEACS